MKGGRLLHGHHDEVPLDQLEAPPPRVGPVQGTLLQSPAGLGHVGADLVARLGERIGGHLGQTGVVELLEVQACRASRRADTLSDHDVEGPAHGPAMSDLERRTAP